MRTSFTSLLFILCTFASVRGVTIRKSLVPESFLSLEVTNMQMLNTSCPQTIMSDKWECLAKVAGADVQLFISLREDVRFCPGKRGWSKWRCLAKLAGAKFKKNFGGVHRKIASLANKLKSKSKPLVNKIKAKASDLVGKLKKKVTKKGGEAKVASTVKNQAKKAGKKSKIKNLVKAGALTKVVSNAKGRITQGQPEVIKSGITGIKKQAGKKRRKGTFSSAKAVAKGDSGKKMMGLVNGNGKLPTNSGPSPYVGSLVGGVINPADPNPYVNNLVL